MKLIHGDCLEELKKIQDNSVDACVTDPPYGLSFMGKKWDYKVPSIEMWKEVLRVLKPGGHLLSFGGTRTYHRMVVNIEDAGFEIRDQLQWLYGSGFPKSHNISKGIDKKYGAKREVVGQYKSPEAKTRKNTISTDSKYRPNQIGQERIADAKITAPATKLAKQYDGYGTALKPSNEPIVLARKPLSEKTVVDNVLKWGTGGLNIDECRIETKDNLNGGAYSNNRQTSTNKVYGEYQRIEKDFKQPQGRWPANTLFDYAAAQMLDEQSGINTRKDLRVNCKSNLHWNKSKQVESQRVIDLGGGASRFFYVAKASKRERNAGLEGTKQKQGNRPNSADPSGKFPDHDHRETGANNHPTVKPIKLMEYLCKLITPHKGIVLDPFMGSGTTGIACKNVSKGFIGIELDKQYYDIAVKRIKANKELK